MTTITTRKADIKSHVLVVRVALFLSKKEVAFLIGEITRHNTRVQEIEGHAVNSLSATVEGSPFACS